MIPNATVQTPERNCGCATVYNVTARRGVRDPECNQTTERKCTANACYARDRAANNAPSCGKLPVGRRNRAFTSTVAWRQQMSGRAGVERTPPISLLAHSAPFRNKPSVPSIPVARVPAIASELRKSADHGFFSRLWCKEQDHFLLNRETQRSASRFVPTVRFDDLSSQARRTFALHRSGPKSR